MKKPLNTGSKIIQNPIIHMLKKNKISKKNQKNLGKRLAKDKNRLLKKNQQLNKNMRKRMKLKRQLDLKKNK